MHISTNPTAHQSAIASLFTATFTASEGPDEGAMIGSLAGNLMRETAEGDIHVFAAHEGDALVGAIIFSRLTYAGDGRQVFVLGPVAVATDHQGKGVGQKLIAHGLDALRAGGVDIAVTYGDPAFYGRTGFAPITQELVPAPFDLQYPHGWLGQSLTDTPIGTLAGPCRCVPAFDDPAFW